MPLTYATTCRLCTPESAFRINAVGFDEINVFAPGPRVEQFLIALGKHIMDAARRESKAMERLTRDAMPDPQAAQRFVLEHGKHVSLANSTTVLTRMNQALSTLMGFDTLDPELAAARERARIFVHAMTARRLAADVIRTGVSELGFLEPDEAELVVQFVIRILDASNGMTDGAPPVPGGALVKLA